MVLTGQRVGPSSSGCKLSAENAQKLTESVDSIRTLAEGINERLCNTEAASNWQERFYEASMHVENDEHVIQQLQASLDEANGTVEAERGENQQLQELLQDLQEEVQVGHNASEKCSEEMRRLEDSIAGKNQELADFNDKLKQLNEQLTNQAHTIQQHEQSQRDSQEQEQRYTVAKETVKNDMIILQKEIDDLTEKLRHTEAERESLRLGHDEWSSTRLEIVQIRQIMQDLARAKSKAEMNELLLMLLRLGTKISEKLGESGDRRQVASSRRSTRQRQMQVRFPNDDEDSRIQVSTNEERAPKRKSTITQGIMKTASREELAYTDADEQGKTPSAAQEHGGSKPSTKKSKGSGNTHGIFNQRVIGTVPAGGKEEKHDNLSTSFAPAAKPRFVTPPPVSMGDDSVPEPPKKREGSSTNTRQKPLGGRTASSYFGGPDTLTTSETNCKSAQVSAKRALITYGSQPPSLKCSESQESPTFAAGVRSSESKSNNKPSRRRRSSSTGKLPSFSVEKMGELELFEDV